MKTYKLFIDNEWCEASDGKTFVTTNPANGQEIAKVASATVEDVERAVLAARKAFDDGPWPRMSAMERGRVLKKCAEILMKRLEEFALVETLDVGKPIKESRLFDIPMCADCFEFYGNFIVSVNGESIPAGDDVLDYTLKEPVGVIGAITPWNFPMALAIRKIAPAIAAGNTMVIKPATVTPLTTLMLGEVFQEAGLPKGVVNVVTGRGSVVGEALTGSKLIDKYSFTGSTEIGSEVMKKAACNICSASLELGGKSPAIVLKDANIDTAVKAILFGVFLNQGECCCASTRVLIDRSIHDEFMEKFVAAAKKIKVGPGEKDTTQMGPLVSKEHQKTVLDYIDKGVKQGAKIALGGNVKLEGELAKGYFVMPTIFDGVTPEMAIYQEEIFGPVQCVTAFDSEEELIEAANDTTYGLAASIFTEDLRKGHVLARKLKAGTVWINIHNFVFSQAPYGGYKQSGLGRELGKEGLEAYMETKNVITYLASPAFSWYE
jgi:acyl-CoA reductase-like NAD-dependent aldehyde dehydrogenase